MEIIGRTEEMAQLNGFADSNRPEFVAVYGRRRVGKTFLIPFTFISVFDERKSAKQGGIIHWRISMYNSIIRSWRLYLVMNTTGPTISKRLRLTHGLDSVLNGSAWRISRR